MSENNVEILMYDDVDESKLQWTDITGYEDFRTYVYKDGEYTITKPCKLLVTRKDGGDRHRIIDEAGNRHYIRPGWFGFYFKGKWGKLSK